MNDDPDAQLLNTAEEQRKSLYELAKMVLEIFFNQQIADTEQMERTLEDLGISKCDSEIVRRRRKDYSQLSDRGSPL